MQFCDGRHFLSRMDRWEVESVIIITPMIHHENDGHSFFLFIIIIIIINNVACILINFINSKINNEIKF
jgi:hypothetical protein